MQITLLCKCSSVCNEWWNKCLQTNEFQFCHEADRGVDGSATPADDWLAVGVINNATEEWLGAVRTAGMIDEAVKLGGLSVQTMWGSILTGWIWLQIWFILARTGGCRDEIRQRKKELFSYYTRHQQLKHSQQLLQQIWWQLNKGHFLVMKNVNTQNAFSCSVEGNGARI